MQHILKNSVAASQFSEKIKKEFLTYSKEIELKQKALKEKQEKFIENRDLIAQESLLEKQAEFITEISNLEKEANQKKQSLEKKYLDYLATLRTEIENIIENLSKEKGYNLVIPKEQTIYINDIDDLTDTVLQKLNIKK